MALVQNDWEGDIRQVKLRLLHFAAVRKLPQGMIRASARFSFDDESIVAKLEQRVWARALHEEVLESPATWIEAIKERFAPRWLLRRWPIQRTKVDMRVYHAYPTLEIQGHKPILQVAFETQPDGEE